MLVLQMMSVVKQVMKELLSLLLVNTDNGNPTFCFGYPTRPMEDAEAKPQREKLLETFARSVVSALTSVEEFF